MATPAPSTRPDAPLPTPHTLERETVQTVRASLWRELRAATRSLWHSPRYSVPALLLVALETGASLAVFAVFNALTLRPLPLKALALHPSTFRGEWNHDWRPRKVANQRGHV